MVDIFTHMRMVDFYGIYIRKYLNIPYTHIYMYMDPMGKKNTEMLEVGIGPWSS